MEGSRIEAGFRKYIRRADPEPVGEVDQAKEATDSKAVTATGAKPAATGGVDTVDILVCHGNVIRYFMCRALQLPPDAWLRLGIHNGSISILDIRPSGRMSVRTFGEVGYMPEDRMTHN